VNWQMNLGDLRALVLPTVALRLRDDFSGHPPRGRVEIRLEQELDGAWEVTEQQVARTPSGVVYFPKLGRSATPRTEPNRRYRVRVGWPLGRPLYSSAGGYPSEQAGVVFEVEAWNRYRRPTSAPPPHPVALLPGPNYPFPAHVPVLRGTIRDGAGDPVADALVEFGAQERVLSDDHGRFALPLRGATPGSVTLDVRDLLGRATTHTLAVPDELELEHDIVLT
jgi:hypothetical protein